MEKKKEFSEIPTLHVDEILLCHSYVHQCLGGGHEGDVYEYDSDYAIKVFTYANLERVEQKLAKIKELMKFHDESFCFPLGLVDFSSPGEEDSDSIPKAYYMEKVERNRYFKDFEKLYFMSQFYENSFMLNFILQGDAAIKRIHRAGAIIGDLKGENILIDNDNQVKFCDTDNYMFGNFGFDADPHRAHYLESIYDDDTVDPKDNDIFLYAMLAVEILASKERLFKINLSSKFLRRMVELMDTSKSVREGFSYIFSDASEKPYLSEVIKDLDCDKKILSKKAIDELKSIKGV